MKRLIHWLRMIFEPDHSGLISRQPRRWYVLYADGQRSIPMGYRMAHEYAGMFKGEVKRFEGKA